MKYRACQEHIHPMSYLPTGVRCFTGLEPPKEAREIGRQQTATDTYIYYKDDNNKLWYTSQSQLEFEQLILGHEKRTGTEPVPMV